MSVHKINVKEAAAAATAANFHKHNALPRATPTAPTAPLARRDHISTSLPAGGHAATPRARRAKPTSIRSAPAAGLRSAASAAAALTPLALPRSGDYIALHTDMPVDPRLDERVYRSDTGVVKHDQKVAADREAATRRDAERALQNVQAATQSGSHGTTAGKRRRIAAAREREKATMATASLTRQRIDLGLEETLAAVKSRVGYVPVATSGLDPNPQVDRLTYQGDKLRARHDEMGAQDGVTSARRAAQGVRRRAIAAAPGVARREINATKAHQIALARFAAQPTLAADGSLPFGGLFSFGPAASSPKSERAAKAAEATAIAPARAAAKNPATLRTLERQYVARQTRAAQSAVTATLATARQTDAKVKSNLATVRSLLGYVHLETDTSTAAKAQATHTFNETFALPHDRSILQQRALQKPIHQYVKNLYAERVRAQRQYNAAPTAALKRAVIVRAKAAVAVLEHTAGQQFSAAGATEKTQFTALQKADAVIGAKADYVSFKADPTAFSRPLMNYYGTQQAGGRTYAQGAQLNAIVTHNLGRAPKAVIDQIHSIGGKAPKILIVPLQFTNGKAVATSVLFRIKNATGTGSHYVDATGARFSSLSDYRQNNSLGSGTMSVMSTTSDLKIKRDAHGNVATFVGNSHVSGDGGVLGFLKAGVKFLGSGTVMIAGGVIMGVGAAAEVFSGGLATPLVAGDEVLGSSLLADGVGSLTARVGARLAARWAARTTIRDAASLGPKALGKWVGGRLISAGVAAQGYDTFSALQNRADHGQTAGIFDGGAATNLWIDALGSAALSLAPGAGVLAKGLEGEVAPAALKTAAGLARGSKYLKVAGNTAFGEQFASQGLDLAQHFSWAKFKAMAANLAILAAGGLIEGGATGVKALATKVTGLGKAPAPTTVVPVTPGAAQSGRAPGATTATGDRLRATTQHTTTTGNVRRATAPDGTTTIGNTRRATTQHTTTTGNVKRATAPNGTTTAGRPLRTSVALGAEPSRARGSGDVRDRTVPPNGRIRALGKKKVAGATLASTALVGMLSQAGRVVPSTDASVSLSIARHLAVLYRTFARERLRATINAGEDARITPKQAQFLHEETIKVIGRYVKSSAQVESVDELFRNFRAHFESMTPELQAKAFATLKAGVRQLLDDNKLPGIDPTDFRTLRGAVMNGAFTVTRIANVLSAARYLIASAGPFGWAKAAEASFGLANLGFAYREGLSTASFSRDKNLADRPMVRRAMRHFQSIYAAGGIPWTLGALAEGNVPLTIGAAVFTLGASSKAVLEFQRQRIKSKGGDDIAIRTNARRQAALTALSSSGTIFYQLAYLHQLMSAGSPRPSVIRGSHANGPAPRKTGPVSRPAARSVTRPSSARGRQVVVVPDIGVRVLAGPSSDAKVVGAARSGTFFHATGVSVPDGSGGTFEQVSLARDGARARTYGWVAGQYLKPHPDGAAGARGRIDPVLEKRPERYRALTVRPSDSIASIAARNGFDVARIVALNAPHILNPNIIFAGDTIYIPARRP